MLFDELSPRSRARPDYSVWGKPVRDLRVIGTKYAGLDLSLTSTGAASLRFGRVQHGLVKPRDTKQRGVERLAWLRNVLSNSIDREEQVRSKLVCIEGYSFGSVSNHHSIGEWGGVAKLVLHDHGIPFIVATPSQVKKFVSGNHQAKKPEMVLALYKRWGVDCPQEDMADAIGCALIAAAFDDENIMPLTAFQREVIAKIRKEQA